MTKKQLIKLKSDQLLTVEFIYYFLRFIGDLFYYFSSFFFTVFFFKVTVIKTKLCRM